MSVDHDLHPVTGLEYTRVSDLARIEDEVARDAWRLQALLRLAKDLNRLSHVDEVLERISQTVFDMLGHATHISVAVRTPEGFEPRFGSSKNGDMPADEIWVSPTMVALVTMSQMALLFDPGDVGTTAQTMHDHRSASSMSIPLQGANDWIGVMQVDNRETDERFSKGDLDLGILLGSSAASALERARLQHDIESMFAGFVEASVTAIEARDPTTSGHSRRVAAFAVALADSATRVDVGPLAQWSFNDADLREVAYASLLHDFGKVGVSEKILVKANRLFPEDVQRIRDRFLLIAAIQQIRLWQRVMTDGDVADAHAWVAKRSAHFRRHLDRSLNRIMKMDAAGRIDDSDADWMADFAQLTWTDLDGKTQTTLSLSEAECLSIRRGTLTAGQRAEIEQHVVHSHRVLTAIPWSGTLSRVPQIVEAHHEKIDGSGYPNGLSGGAIPRQARLMTVVDIFDALTASDRPYRTALPAERGLDILRMEAQDGKIDSDIVKLFIESKIWKRPAPIAWMRHVAFGGQHVEPPVHEDHDDCPGIAVCAK